MAGISRRDVLKSGGAFLAAAGFAPASALAQEARFFRIATGPTESGYFTVGTLISSVVSSPPGARDCARGGSCGVPGLIAVAQTTAGSVANVEAIAAQRFESGLCQADIAYWAFHGTGPYRRQGAVKNLRAIANLYPETMHVVARDNSGIREIRHLRGKRVSLGEKESGTLVTARAILQSLGIGERDLRVQNLKPGEAADALREGKLDAFFEMTGAPSTTIVDLAKDIDIRLVPIAGQNASRLRAAFPFFTESTIPAKLYRNVDDTPSLNIGALWLVAADVDEKIVYGLTRALWHPNNRKALDAGNPFGKLIRQQTAVDGVALQLHSGAALYYFEAGIIR
ncbi:MAG: TAXI family TRAP transporter solute-binding subunit [Rhodospirillales bacterium]|nr:TAXI family TRAP transporter solute-binding subunit [Rhodospirillales bacterium]